MASDRTALALTGHSFDSSGEWDFFAPDKLLSNHLGWPRGPAKYALGLADKTGNAGSSCFSQVRMAAPRDAPAPRILIPHNSLLRAQVGLANLAKFDRHGNEATPIQMPFKVMLVPTTAVKGISKPQSKTIDELFAEIMAIPAGTAIYKWYACGAAAGAAELTPTKGPLWKACKQPTYLGEIRTTDKCTTSGWADRYLMYRHDRIEDDWKLAPEYLNQYDAKAACNMDRVDLTWDKKCPGTDGFSKNPVHRVTAWLNSTSAA